MSHRVAQFANHVWFLNPAELMQGNFIILTQQVGLNSFSLNLLSLLWCTFCSISSLHSIRLCFVLLFPQCTNWPLLYKVVLDSTACCVLPRLPSNIIVPRRRSDQMSQTSVKYTERDQTRRLNSKKQWDKIINKTLRDEERQRYSEESSVGASVWSIGWSSTHKAPQSAFSLDYAALRSAQCSCGGSERRRHKAQSWNFRPADMLGIALNQK